MENSKFYLAFPADNRQGLGQEDSSYLGGGSPDWFIFNSH